MTGYNITCNNAGGLYNQQCYDSQGHEIIAYTSTGAPIGYDGQSGKTYLSALDSSGNVYDPYGSAGIPYTIQDSGPISSVVGNWMPSGGADPQAFLRLMTMPGAAARQREASTTVPWYYNVFGLKTQPEVVGGQWWPSWMSFSTESSPKGDSNPTQTIFGKIANWFNFVEASGTRMARAGIATVGVLGVMMIMRKRGE